MEQSYHYMNARLVEIKRNSREPFLTARVTCEVRVTHRWYVAGIPAGLPEAPEGYSYWAPVSDQWELRRNLIAARRQGLGKSIVRSTPLPKMFAPHGTLLTEETELTSLARKAIEGLGSAAFSKATTKRDFYLQYSPDHSAWVLRSEGSRPASPTPNLSWDYGTEGFNPTFVGHPSLE